MHCHHHNKQTKLANDNANSESDSSNELKEAKEKHENLVQRSHQLMKMNEQLKLENNSLSKKLKSIKKYKIQQGCIKLKLEKFRALALNPKHFLIYSESIKLAGFKWKFCAERSPDNWLGLFLCIYVPKDVPKKWECRVNYTFCIKHSNDVEACVHRGNMKPVDFSDQLGRCGRSGFADVVGIHHLLDPQSGFVDLHDVIKMGVSFSVLYSSHNQA